MSRRQPLVRTVKWICVGYLLMNLLYAVKSLLNIDLLPGHNGRLFPLGEWIWSRYRIRFEPLSFQGSYFECSAPRLKGIATGGMSEGWYDASTWSPVRVHYGKIDSGLRSQPWAQSVTVDPIGNEGVWQMVQRVSVKSGAQYRMSSVVRSDSGMLVGLALRSVGPPYTTYFSRFSRITRQWARISASGKLPVSLVENGRADFMFVSRGRGEIDIVDANLKQLNH